MLPAVSIVLCFITIVIQSYMSHIVEWRLNKSNNTSHPHTCTHRITQTFIHSFTHYIAVWPTSTSPASILREAAPNSTVRTRWPKLRLHVVSETFFSTGATWTIISVLLSPPAAFTQKMHHELHTDRDVWPTWTENYHFVNSSSELELFVCQTWLTPSCLWRGPGWDQDPRRLKRRRLYSTLHSHHQNRCCILIGSGEGHFNVLLFIGG